MYASSSFAFRPLPPSVTFSYVFFFFYFETWFFSLRRRRRKKRVRSSRCCLCWLTGWLIQASHYSSLTLSPPFCMSVLSESRYCRRFFFFLLHLPRLIAPRTHALAGSRHGLKDQSIVPTVWARKDPLDEGGCEIRRRIRAERFILCRRESSFRIPILTPFKHIRFIWRAQLIALWWWLRPTIAIAVLQLLFRLQLRLQRKGRGFDFAQRSGPFLESLRYYMKERK